MRNGIITHYFCNMRRGSQFFSACELALQTSGSYVRPRPEGDSKEKCQQCQHAQGGNQAGRIADAGRDEQTPEETGNQTRPQ